METLTYRHICAGNHSSFAPLQHSSPVIPLVFRCKRPFNVYEQVMFQ